ncbi:hypothetical protein [Erythrobacter sp. JK5]|uniref:hypothetical protein n=1 Tax=Erythrobacter sp. JK5 TaxID=2829500 RepID=UPI001BADB93B|nr:hypothetical protein [Erythrobacter sp. JK5]QUL38410.1 hypothetical protein KDC96_03060 [Erythrobacter sp. JK5]
MAHISRFGALAGLIAAASMASTPAFAADLPDGLVIQPADASAVFADFDSTTYDADTDIAQRHRGWGWRRGWRRHRRGVRAGDVLAGVLILGGIAAVASAANDNRRRERDVVIVDRDRDYDYDRRDDRRYDRRDDRRGSGASGLDSAVSQCLDRIERDVRVDSVDSVDRTGEGWLVTGSLFNGTGFACRIGNDGRIADIDYGGLADRGEFDESGLAEFEAEGQLDDSTYRAARGSVAAEPTRRIARAEIPADAAPAYPGGLAPGQTIPETADKIDGDLDD